MMNFRSEQVEADALTISESYGGEIPLGAARVIADSAHRNLASGAWPRKPLSVDAGEHTELLERLGIILRIRGRYTLTSKGISIGYRG